MKIGPMMRPGEVVIDGPGHRSREHRAIALAALALQAQDAMSPVVSQVLDISAESLVDPQAGMSEQ